MASNNNIVLQPSSDEFAFDSYKVGGAKVHRYKQQSNVNHDETEYVMWYHGRSQDMKNDSSLPQLSTGRIGRATSRNGLHWIKDKIGSASEDRPDVSLGLNTESWWSFDTAHIGLGNVLLPMDSPAVLTEGGVYIMYYMGGNKEETPLVDYMGKTLPDTMKDAKIQGMKMKIGVAISQDGITWGRVEGDDPSGAILAPWDKTDLSQQQDFALAGGRVDEELYCAWPDVVTNLQSTDKSTTFLMFYSTMTKKDKKKCIAYAVSSDGFRWTKRGICLQPDTEGLDAGGCARCCILRDASFDDSTQLWTERSSWTMYYEGVSLEDKKSRIMVASSRDGKTWVKSGLALDIEEGAVAWDAGGVGSPYVVRMDDGTMRMYYTGQGIDGMTAIGVAKLEHDSAAIKWVREQATIPFLIE